MLTIAVFLPLIGSIFSGLLPKTLGKKWAIWIPTLVLTYISFIVKLLCKIIEVIRVRRNHLILTLKCLLQLHHLLLWNLIRHVKKRHC